MALICVCRLYINPCMRSKAELMFCILKRVLSKVKLSRIIKKPLDTLSRL